MLFGLFLLRRLEVVYRFYATDDLCGGGDVLDDLVHAFVRHGGLIEGVGEDAGGIDARHLALVLLHSETLKGGGTRHKTACTVRRGIVPILVSLTHANK